MSPPRSVGMPLSERRSLSDMWRDLEAKTLGPGIGPIQRQEMRRAFYAGAAAWADLMLTGLDEDHEPTDLDLAYVSQLHDELQAFGKAIQAGRA